MRTRIKICGITRPEDGRLALEAGADYLGMILTESPRQLSLEDARAVRRALPSDATVVGVFADEPPEVVEPYVKALGLHAVQVRGWIAREAPFPAEIWDVLRESSLPDPTTLPMVPLRTYLLDAHDAKLPGGTGRRSDWIWAKRCVEVGRRLFVAGGLNAGNVEGLIDEVRPFGVDASSGLEASVGRKSPEKVRAFIERVRACDRVRSKRS
jgi:phosphoribosylanthranilate isomerase